MCKLLSTSLCERNSSLQHKKGGGDKLPSSLPIIAGLGFDISLRERSQTRSPPNATCFYRKREERRVENATFGFYRVRASPSVYSIRFDTFRAAASTLVGGGGEREKEEEGSLFSGRGGGIKEFFASTFLSCSTGRKAG